MDNDLPVTTQTSPTSQDGTSRSRLRPWAGWACLTILVILLAAAWWFWPLVPPRQTITPDSPEAWRALMRHPSRPVRLAAAILLASKGDAEATKALLETFPSLTKEEEHVALEFLLGLAGEANLAPPLIEAFLNHPESCNTGDPAGVLKMIPPGQETRYLPSLFSILDRATPKSRSWNGEGYEIAFWPVIDSIAAAGNREALERSHKAIRQALRFKADNGNYGAGWRLARFLAAYCAENPAEGFRAIEKEYPQTLVSETQAMYLWNLCEHRHYKAAVDLWLVPLPDDRPTTSGSTALDWANLGNPTVTPSLRAYLARGIAGVWPKVPKEQKMRLSEKDKDGFSLAFARHCESRGDSSDEIRPTRETLLRLLQEPTGQVINSLQSLQQEEDLRPILIREALQTQDLKRARDLLYALHCWFGGIPREVADRARQFLVVTSTSTRDDAQRQKEIVQLLSEPSPRKVTPTVYHSFPFQDSSTPWVLRRNRTQRALDQMRAVQMGLAQYSVDWSGFPSHLSSLTTPVGFIKWMPPDMCAGSGPYSYATLGCYSFGYAITSPGPDGFRDISPQHCLLTRALQGISLGVAGKTPYVRLTPNGYEFLDQFEPGADVVLLYDRTLWDRMRHDGSRVEVPE